MARLWRRQFGERGLESLSSGRGGAEPKHGHHCVPFKDPFLVTLEKRGCSKYKELFL